MTLESAQTSGNAQTNRRRAPRSIAPIIQIRCEGKLFVPDDWGLGGCRISNYQGQLRPGTSVLIELFLNVAHEHDGLPVRAEIVRFEPDNDNALALCFVDLSAQDIIEFCNIVDEALSPEIRKAIE